MIPLRDVIPSRTTPYVTVGLIAVSNFVIHFWWLLLLAVGVATITLLLLATTQLEERMGRDARGIDMVAGAKGSPMQLVLSAIYHLDAPTGNIPLADALAQLDNRFPGLRFRIVTEQDRVRPHIRLFVNEQQAFNLQTPLRRDDELYIVLALSGG